MYVLSLPASIITIEHATYFADDIDDMSLDMLPTNTVAEPRR
jgi:hypothetical protein